MLLANAFMVMMPSVTRYLLEEVSRGGCVDTQHQALCLQMMVLCPEDVSKVQVQSSDKRYES